MVQQIHTTGKINTSIYEEQFYHHAKHKKIEGIPLFSHDFSILVALTMRSLLIYVHKYNIEKNNSVYISIFYIPIPAGLRKKAYINFSEPKEKKDKNKTKAMASQKLNFCLLLSMAIILVITRSSEANGAVPMSPYCKICTIPILCNNVVNGATNWKEAMVKSINACMENAYRCGCQISRLN